MLYFHSLNSQFYASCINILMLGYPFTLTFVNGTPTVEKNHIIINFTTSRLISSAHCLLRNSEMNLETNC